MGSNLAVLLLNKLLLSFWSFKQPVLLTFLHMVSGMALTWGLWGAKLLTVQRIQSREQLTKIFALSFVFAMAVLTANVSLKFLAVSMNQAIGAATPVFAAMFSFTLQGQIEHPLTYATLAVVVGGVVISSGVEPNLHMFGAAICFISAAFRGLRAVLQAMLLKPEEKLDSISCLAYMTPVSSVLMLVLCGVLEPSGYSMLVSLPVSGFPMLAVLSANCLVAFASNFLNMAVTKRTSALSIQVLGQCKGVISAVVSVFCFHNFVPVFGWIGYGITVVGCIAYGRCKAHFQALSVQKEIEDDNEEWVSLAHASSQVHEGLSTQLTQRFESPKALGGANTAADSEGISGEDPARNWRSHRHDSINDDVHDSYHGNRLDEPFLERRRRAELELPSKAESHFQRGGGEVGMKSVPTTASLRSMIAASSPIPVFEPGSDRSSSPEGLSSSASSGMLQTVVATQDLLRGRLAIGVA